jgi:DNA-binding transcriptional LysR family regulator
VISTVQDNFLSAALLHFRRKQPVAHLNIVPGTSLQLLTGIDSHELDIAVMIKPRLGLPSDLRWIPLMQERYVGVAPVDWPSDLGELFRERPLSAMTAVLTAATSSAAFSRSTAYGQWTASKWMSPRSF